MGGGEGRGEKRGSGAQSQGKSDSESHSRVCTGRRQTLFACMSHTPRKSCPAYPGTAAVTSCHQDIESKARKRDCCRAVVALPPTHGPGGKCQHCCTRGRWSGSYISHSFVGVGKAGWCKQYFSI